MARKMKIIEAGDLVKQVIYTAPEPRDGPQVRAQKSRATSEAQKRMNDRSARERLEMEIATNFTRRDLFLTYTYDDEHFPATRKEAENNLKKVIRSLRSVRRKQGHELKYIYVTENEHGEGRIHHHLIINATERDIETLLSLWPYGDVVDIEPLGKAEWGQWAGYMTKEGGERPVGRRMWTPSRNLKKPTIRSYYVPDNATLEIPREAEIMEGDRHDEGPAFYWFVKYRLLPTRWDTKTHGPQYEKADIPAFLACGRI